MFAPAGSAGANSVMEMEEEHADAMFAAIETGNWERFSIALSATNINMGNVVTRPHTTKLQERLSDQLPVRMCMIDVSPEGSGANADIGQSAPAVLGASRTDIRDWGSVRACNEHTHGRARSLLPCIVPRTQKTEWRAIAPSEALMRVRPHRGCDGLPPSAGNCRGKVPVTERASADLCTIF